MAQGTFSIRLDPDIREQLSRLAQSTGCSVNFLLNQAIREYLERERWHVADIEQGLRELAAGDVAALKETEEVFARITTPENLERARARVAQESW